MIREIATAAAVIGLAIISIVKRRRPWLPTNPAARAAVLAAVSHSSSRRLVTTSRTSVSEMAWRASKAWNASSVRLRRICATVVEAS